MDWWLQSELYIQLNEAGNPVFRIVTFAFLKRK